MSHDINKLIENVVKEVLSEKNLPQKGIPQKFSCSKITLAAARELIRAVQSKAADMGVNAVVAVSNGSGNVIAVECMDNSYIASYDIAVNKTFTAVSLKMPTSKLALLASPGGSLYGIQHTNGGKIVIFGGGETLECCGEIIGGLGVSGGTAEQDTTLGEFGKQYFENKII